MKKYIIILVYIFAFLAKTCLANEFAAHDKYWITFFNSILYHKDDKLSPNVAINSKGEIFVLFSKNYWYGGGFTNPGYIQVVKIDKNGRIVGEKYIGTYRPDSFYYCMLPMGITAKDSTTIEVFTFMKSGTTGFEGIGVIRLDTDLRVLETLPLMRTSIVYSLNYIESIPDGYIISAHSRYRGLLVRRVDRSGRIIWSHTYSGYGWGLKSLFTPDSSIFVIGAVGVDLDYASCDSIAIVKLDGRDGAPKWIRHIPQRISTCTAKHTQLIPTQDGGVMIVLEGCYSLRYSYLVYIYDSLGNLVKRQNYRECGDIIVKYMMPLPDSTFLAVGTDTSLDTAVLAKIDTAGYWGRIIWLKKYSITRHYSPFRVYYETFYQLFRAPDNGLIFTGKVSASEFYNKYFFIMKTDSLGETGISEQVSLFPQKRELTAHPNPFNRACRITLPYDDNWRVKIFNPSGRLVHDFGEISGKSILWSPSDDVKSGIYVVVAEGKRSYTRGKVVYIK